MKKHINRSMKVCFLPVSVAAFLLTGSSVLAQPVQQGEEITVVTPHTIDKKRVGTSLIGAPIEEISLTHRVNFSDLDLRKQSDVAILESRVKDAATLGCKELDQLYPDSMFPPVAMNKSCFQTAMDGTMPQVAEAIAEARR